MISALLPATLSARSLVPNGEGTVWKYFDEGTGPDAEWLQPGFDDSAWKSGKAPLGFGETRLATALESKPFIASFRHEFDLPGIPADEGLVILLCVDDGAIVHLNGKELDRTNMPDGPVAPTTAAVRTIADRDEGFYERFHVPADVLLAGEMNVIAVEVHNISATSSDLYFDLALKTVPAEASSEVSATAGEVVIRYNEQHYLGPEMTIPDGYIDGGRRMTIDTSGEAASGRELLTVDRPRDTELANDLAFARSAELRALPEIERVQRIAEWIDRETTPPGGIRLVTRTTDMLLKQFVGKALLIGDWVDQCHAGVCRHRSLLFKILADEAGLKTALVRGNYIRDKKPGIAHAWNESFFADGRHVIVDVMHNGGKARFLEVTDPYVIEHYLRVDDTPWYGTREPDESPDTPRD